MTFRNDDIIAMTFTLTTWLEPNDDDPSLFDVYVKTGTADGSATEPNRADAVRYEKVPAELVEPLRAELAASFDASVKASAAMVEDAITVSWVAPLPVSWPVDREGTGR